MKSSKLLLMSCCAPCSAAAVKRLKKDGADFCVLFYNPNIFPRAEYDRRLDEQIKLCDKLGVRWATSRYDHAAWLRAVRGHEKDPERGARCEKCFAMRLRYGADWARANGCGRIASVFGVSPHKDAAQVRRAARAALGPDSDIEYIDADFGYAPEPGGYRQKYCGCEFSETYNGGN
ncbi:MAG: epoxyqueuosine reductase QueH [Rickettsiales bacterium]|jgi:predicted adenine nucleotide alpha hydrolase (AANH) superfamily ATPase|nr:epoxyqueuosine reductase QueH [Rickettsiales bacterium]